MDLYTGGIDPEQVGRELLSQLEMNNKDGRDAYTQLIKANKGFLKLELHDGSAWILRLSDDPERYIHVHPARYSVYSMRVKSVALKVAMIASSLFPDSPELSLDQIDHIRTTYLGMNPVGKPQGKSFQDTLRLLYN